MHHIDYGLAAMRADVLLVYPDDEALDLATVYEDFVVRHALAAYEVTARFYETGAPADLSDMAQHLAQGRTVSYARQHLEETARIVEALDSAVLDRMAVLLGALRDRGGCLFVLGVGGNAANASHAVNDFRKLAGIEASTPVDNVSELTARTNDEGWNTVFSAWLDGSRLKRDDMVLVFSVGGGNAEHNISPNIVKVLIRVQEIGAQILGIVGRDGGFTAAVANECIIVPTVNLSWVTPHTEGFQATIWHLLVSHPRVKARETKWESTP